MIAAVAFAAWGAFCWVLRGGLFGAVVRRTLGIEPGTTVTRIAATGALVAPLLFLGAVGWPVAVALWATCYVATTIGYFGEAMGLERGARDVLFMSAWGVVVFTIALTGANVTATPFVDPPTLILMVDGRLAWALVGAAAGPAYAAQKPLGRRFGTDWTERSEATVGGLLGGALGAVVGLWS